MGRPRSGLIAFWAIPVYSDSKPMPPISPTGLQTQLLARIAILLRIIVISIVIAFCFVASSVCLTLLLSVFLAVLIDPVVTHLQHWHIPRSLAAALIILVFMAGMGFAGAGAYNKSLEFIDQLPQLTSRVRDAVSPLTDKIQRVQYTAGSLSLSNTPAKRVPEVKIRETPTWPSYIVRGVGSVWGAVVIAGVVPFLVFFMLIRKKQMSVRFESWLGQRIDVPLFVSRASEMVRGFVVGNLTIGVIMSAVTVGILELLKNANGDCGHD